MYDKTNSSKEQMKDSLQVQSKSELDPGTQPGSGG